MPETGEPELGHDVGLQASSGHVPTPLEAHDLGRVPGELRELESARARAELATHAAEWRRLAEVLATVIAEPDLTVALHHMVRAAAEAMGLERNSLLLVDRDASELVLVASVGLPLSLSAEIARLPVGPFGPPCGVAACSGEAVIVEDVLADQRWQEYHPLAQRHGIRAIWSVPLVGRGGRVLGTFAAYDTRAHAPSRHQLELLTLYAHSAAIVVERARAQARESELARVAAARAAELAAVLEQLPLGVVVVDAHGRLRLISEAGRRILGALPDFARPLPEQAVDYHLREPGALHPLCPEETPIARALRGEALDDQELLLRGLGAAVDVCLRVSARPLRDESGAVVGAASVFEDISERRKAEEALRETNRRLQAALEELRRTERQVIQQERLRALGQMASGVVHDFNNALSLILGYTELLLHRPGALGNPGQLRETLELIGAAARDAAGVVSRLREFYRTDSGGEVAQALDLPALVQEVVALTQPRWQEQTRAAGIPVTVETDLQPTPPVLGSAGALRDALINLLFNAVDALPRGGSIVVRARAEGAHAVLEVADTGVGMTEEVLLRCLEPFYSTKGEGGTGLGLAMVYGIVQRHGGTLNIASAPGEGTAVTIRLPVVQGVPAAGASAAPDLPPARRLRVLVVEDDPTVLRLLISYLRADGHVVTTAANGAEGLARFREGEYDLVVTDLSMPVMTGEQLAVEIKRLVPTQPVILLTGFGGEIARAEGVAGGPDLVLTKPLTLAQLRAALARAVSGRSPEPPSRSG